MRLPDCRCGADKFGDEAFSGRLERNDTGHRNARSLRDASHRTRARRTACGSPNIDPPFPSSSRCRPPTKQASLAPRSRRAPRTWSARPSTPRSRPTTTRRVRLPHLARLSTNGTADARLPRADRNRAHGDVRHPPEQLRLLHRRREVRGRMSSRGRGGRVHVVAPKRRFSSTRMFLFSFFSFAPEDARRPTSRPPLRGPCASKKVFTRTFTPESFATPGTSRGTPATAACFRTGSPCTSRAR